MKTLLLVRHAKSSWANEGQDDFDRPLNDRGKKDAPEMAKKVKAKLSVIDLFVSSTAKRAHKTAKLFAEAFSIEKEDILLFDSLYHAAPATIYQTVAGLPDTAASAILFAHNPGITEFANMLTNVRIDDMPTCSVFAVAADVATWKEFVTAEKQFLFFDYPKNPLG
ncbi:phosphohistidine phosphatase [Cnuella takakiae]|uniref:Phosphohistidine phosphatase n=1 Tax=Cnuella takakiae TaxID=1302690 RepID=A0A1M5D138_9BACT|nr:histidine phosphatase family protein [Cnuella takakiae]OLY94145.1 phosphohistidine phosphatase [Cnuella takakiae]SHF60590.1 phosphohistidine phosphatase [Cnuella takakiae]